MLVGDAEHGDQLFAAERPVNFDLVAFLDVAMRLGRSAPLTITLFSLHAFAASERVLNRHATSSQMSSRTESRESFTTKGTMETTKPTKTLIKCIVTFVVLFVTFVVKDRPS